MLPFIFSEFCANIIGMIDCLSNPNWINPQIDFLLFLQNIRVNHFEIYDKFFLSITVFGEFWLPTLICAITYWCIDFMAGLYLFSSFGLNAIATHFFKMLACVYRPWVLSNEIHPSKLAVPFAKGYSFPSGHSATSASVLGGVAYLLRHKKILCTLLICLVLLIGFSRLWLGVHTPQDVVCGLSIGLVLVFAVNKIIRWAELNTDRYLYLAFITDIIMIAILIYIKYFSTYRMDYISGKLLVDPQKAIYSVVVIYGYIMGLLNGCFLCRRFFPFNPKDLPLKNRILIGAIGGIFIVSVLRIAVGYIILNQTALAVAMPVMLLTGLFITLIYPIIFQHFNKKYIH